MSYDLTPLQIADILHRIHSPEDVDYRQTVNVLGRELQMSPGVLRPDLSETSEIIARYIPDLTGRRGLDVGCGSGILTYTLLARNAPQVVATDILPEAVECTIRNNLEAYERGRLKVYCGDLLDPLKQEEENIHSFGFVICNPPYFEGKPRQGKPIDMALFGGIAFMTRFLGDIHTFLASRAQILTIYSSKGNVHELETLMTKEGFRFEIFEHGIDPRAKYPRNETYYVYLMEEVL